MIQLAIKAKLDEQRKRNINSIKAASEGRAALWFLSYFRRLRKNIYAFITLIKINIALGFPWLELLSWDVRYMRAHIAKVADVSSDRGNRELWNRELEISGLLLDASVEFALQIAWQL